MRKTNVVMTGSDSWIMNNLPMGLDIEPINAPPSMGEGVQENNNPPSMILDPNIAGSNDKYASEVVLTKRKIHRFWLHDSIYNDESWYLPLLKRLNDENNAPDDEIVLYLNNYGGSVYSLTQLIASIGRCKCQVKLYIEGLCASAAAYLAMGGHFSYIEVHPLSDVLIHTARFFTFGKLPDMKDTVDFQSKQTERIVRTYCKDVLTEEEIKDVLRGKELYLSGEEFALRLQEREEKQIKRAKRAEAKEIRVASK